MNQEEYWMDIPGYEGRYQASSFGKIKSLSRVINIRNRYHLKKEKLIKPSVSCGYLTLLLYSGSRESAKTFRVHRLVALTFHKNEQNKPFINHKDGNKLNNYSSNLEWCTRQENVDHAFAMGLMHKHKGPTHHFAKLTEIDIFNIRFNRSQFGIPFHVLGEFYGVSKTAIRDIIIGKNWGHI